MSHEFIREQVIQQLDKGMKQVIMESFEGQYLTIGLSSIDFDSDSTIYTIYSITQYSKEIIKK